MLAGNPKENLIRAIDAYLGADAHTSSTRALFDQLRTLKSDVEQAPNPVARSTGATHADLIDVEEGLNTQEGTRPMDRHDSPGMQAAKRNTRPEYQNRPAKAATAPSPGKQAAQQPTDSREAKETSSDE
jgi:hypothetical protein